MSDEMNESWFVTRLHPLPLSHKWARGVENSFHLGKFEIFPRTLNFRLPSPIYGRGEGGEGGLQTNS